MSSNLKVSLEAFHFLKRSLSLTLLGYKSLSGETQTPRVVCSALPSSLTLEMIYNVINHVCAKDGPALTQLFLIAE